MPEIKPKVAATVAVAATAAAAIALHSRKSGGMAEACGTCGKCDQLGETEQPVVCEESTGQDPGEILQEGGSSAALEEHTENEKTEDIEAIEKATETELPEDQPSTICATASVTVNKHQSPAFCTVTLEDGDMLSVKTEVSKGKRLRIDLYQEGRRNTWNGVLFGLDFEDGDEKTVILPRYPRTDGYTAEVRSLDGSAGTVVLESRKRSMREGDDQ